MEEESMKYTVTEIGATMQKFGLLDYIVFICMLLVCVVVGLYFYYTQSSESAQNYLVGGRSMKIFPVSMSLIASFISGISLLGIPTEIYVYGIQYLGILGGVVLMSIIFQTVFLPVFHSMNITSTYEYLEKRFDKKIRTFGSLLFIIGLLGWLPVVIYVPALAFNQVTGINVHFITPFVCTICIFYTSIGGIKAVVWTDVIQTAFMIGAMILIVIKGTLDVGGFGVVWQRNLDSGRIEGPDFDINPLKRNGIFALIFGGAVYWLQSSAMNQNMIQRYLSLPTLKSANRALWVFILGIFIVLLLCSYSGMVTYATYYNCDPLTTRLAKQKDQLLPLLVMQILGDYPGFPGLFVAGVFSAALSSLSTGLNSMAAIVLEDFYKSFFVRKLTEKQSYVLMKTTVVIAGIICVALVYVVEHLGAVLQLSMSIGAITAGPSLGLFVMGVLIPWINSKGALAGGISGLVFMSWLSLSAQAEIASGYLTFPEKPVNTDGCHYNFVPKTPSGNFTQATSFGLHRVSYLWYALLSCTFTVTVGLLVSLVTKPQSTQDIDLRLLAPFFRRFIKQKSNYNPDNEAKKDELSVIAINEVKPNGLSALENSSFRSSI